MIGDRVGRLIESDLVLNLSPPLAIKDTTSATAAWWAATETRIASDRPPRAPATCQSVHANRKLFDRRRG